MTYHEPDLSQLSHSLIWAGFRRLIPVSLFVAVFGAAFGLAASQKGMGHITATMMSFLVFAGYAQFASLELWAGHVPVLTLIATVFAINARHLLMGATLYPWLRSLTPAKRYGIMMVASDANWAMSIQAFSRGKAGLGLLFGGGLALWLFWGVGTARRGPAVITLFHWKARRRGVRRWPRSGRFTFPPPVRKTMCRFTRTAWRTGLRPLKCRSGRPKRPTMR